MSDHPSTYLSRRRALAGAFTAAALIGAPWPACARGDGSIRLRELYNKDLSFSPLALEMKGTRVAVDGFMAPPLRAETTFFVLTRRPMAVCPFCDDEADWPRDIVAIYAKRNVEVVSFNLPIRVTGVLELGTYRDPELGFVSRVRMADATYERV